MAELQEAFEVNAAEVAQELGYCDPNARGSINDMTRERVAATDGKVTTALRSPWLTPTGS